MLPPYWRRLNQFDEFDGAPHRNAIASECQGLPPARRQRAESPLGRSILPQQGIAKPFSVAVGEWNNGTDEAGFVDFRGKVVDPEKPAKVGNPIFGDEVFEIVDPQSFGWNGLPRFLQHELVVVADGFEIVFVSKKPLQEEMGVLFNFLPV